MRVKVVDAQLISTVFIIITPVTQFQLLSRTNARLSDLLMICSQGTLEKVSKGLKLLKRTFFLFSDNHFLYADRSNAGGNVVYSKPREGFLMDVHDPCADLCRNDSDWPNKQTTKKRTLSPTRRAKQSNPA